MERRYKVLSATEQPDIFLIGEYAYDGNIYVQFYSNRPDYQEWLAAGNTPEPMDPPPPPVPIPPSQSERIEALETMLSMVLDQEAGL